MILVYAGAEQAIESIHENHRNISVLATSLLINKGDKEETNPDRKKLMQKLEGRFEDAMSPQAIRKFKGEQAAKIRISNKRTKDKTPTEVAEAIQLLERAANGNELTQEQRDEAASGKVVKPLTVEFREHAGTLDAEVISR